MEKMDDKKNTKRKHIQLRVDGMLQRPSRAQAKLLDSETAQSYTPPDIDGRL